MPCHLLFQLEDGRQHFKSICGPPSWYHPLSSSCLPPLRAEVNHLGTHGLSCVRNEGRHHHLIRGMPHSVTLYTGPSLQHTSHLVWSHQVYFDQMGNALTASRWYHGRVAGSWCGTRPALTPLRHRTFRVLPVVLERLQLQRKKRKYSHLDQCHLFVPVAIETTGVFGPETMEFLRKLGRRLQLVSADHNSFTNLIQRLSVAVQRGNAASVLGSARSLESQNFFETP